MEEVAEDIWDVGLTINRFFETRWRNDGIDYITGIRKQQIKEKRNM